MIFIECNKIVIIIYYYYYLLNGVTHSIEVKHNNIKEYIEIKWI